MNKMKQKQELSGGKQDRMTISCRVELNFNGFLNV